MDTHFRPSVCMKVTCVVIRHSHPFILNERECVRYVWNACAVCEFNGSSEAD